MISLIGLQLEIDGVKKTLTIEEAKELKRMLLEIFPESPHYVYPNTIPFPGQQSFPSYPATPMQPYFGDPTSPTYRITCNGNTGSPLPPPTQFISASQVVE